ncbi:MAG: glycosyltransferase family 4 protein [Phocaeicola sp.]|uniref:glycosyltransferase family 4 protein n=1 Tax=Phocaeicola sp. TaxID=2773926 RepID=UPI003F9F45E1
MRIGFDGKRAVRNFTGLGNYSRYVLDILSRYYPENEYDIFSATSDTAGRMNVLLKKHPSLKMVYAQGLGKRFPAVWRSWGITHQMEVSGIQIYHGLSNEIPLNIKKSGIKSIVTIHDLIFLRLPECYAPIDRKIYDYKFHQACVDADHIISVSDRTKKDIVELYQIPEEKITTIYQNCDPVFGIPVTEEKKQQVKTTHHLPERYILNVGTIEKRKNALFIVKSLPQLPPDIHLVIVGRRTKYTEEIEKYMAEHQLETRVHILKEVKYEELPAIYQMASLFIYPSIYEGFGIPVLEALNSKVPVITTSHSCMEEAGGKAAVYVNPSDVNELVQAELSILTNSSLRQQLIADGLKQRENFSDELQAKKLIKLYQSLIG